MRRDIEFEVEDGTVLRGYLHIAEDSPAPGIVMAHGFSGVKEQIDHYAAFFADGGFSVLVYDHRGFGASEGTPPLEVDPLRQLADWRDALTFANGLPEVDGENGLGLWGSSFAGGLAMVLAANDRRVRCVVAQIPNVSGHRNSTQMFNVAQLAELRQRFHADRASRLTGGEPAMIPVLSADDGQLPALPPAIDERMIAAALEATPSWRNEVTLRSVEHLIEFEPAGWAPYVSPTPLMMIVATNDTCTFADVQLDVFAAAREPKSLVIHRGGHFDTYTTYFKPTSEAARDWFLTHMQSLHNTAAHGGLGGALRSDVPGAAA
ncbi:MAG: alpha/beta hydrolase [Solirubrobacteraceae bacterium]